MGLFKRQKSRLEKVTDAAIEDKTETASNNEYMRCRISHIFSLGRFFTRIV